MPYFPFMESQDMYYSYIYKWNHQSKGHLVQEPTSTDIIVCVWVTENLPKLLRLTDWYPPVGGRYLRDE